MSATVMKNQFAFALSYLFIICLLRRVQAGCVDLNYCNGHGQCSGSKCRCYEGWDYSLDCAQRTCPHDASWADLPDVEGNAHKSAECSDKGLCNRATGQCKCFSGYSGVACQRYECPNKCSGHGRCMSLREMALTDDALPFTNLTYSVNGTMLHYDHIYGCVFDSGWPVGLRDCETQDPEWFGADCSLRHCPTGDNPRTEGDETDCEGVSPPGPQSLRIGDAGNKCHVDCSEQGVCNYKTGQCQCFNGYFGLNCNINDALAVKDWASATGEGYSTISGYGSGDGAAMGDLASLDLPDLPLL